MNGAILTQAANVKTKRPAVSVAVGPDGQPTDSHGERIWGVVCGRCDVEQTGLTRTAAEARRKAHVCRE